MGVSLIRDDTRRPLWVRLPEINLTKVVGFVDWKGSQRELEAMLESMHNESFDGLGELPLWRITVFSWPRKETSETGDIDVAFFFHHGLCDGMSGVAFHIAFLEALINLTTTNERHPAIVKVPKLDMLPSIEAAHDLPLSIPFIICEVVKAFILDQSDEKCWTGSPVRFEPNITCFRTLYLPLHFVDTLSQLCRSHGVTITSLLTILIARALAKTFPHYPRFCSQTAMSFRRFTGTDNRAIVNYVAPIAHRFSIMRRKGYLECGGDFSWDVVKSCHREVRDATTSPKNQKVGLLKFVNDYAGWFRKQLGHKREYSFSVSNIGILHGRGETDLIPRVKQVLFTQPRNVTGSALAFNVVSAKGGDLSIALSWQKDVVEVDSAENILHNVNTQLQKLTGLSFQS